MIITNSFSKLNLLFLTLDMVMWVGNFRLTDWKNLRIIWKSKQEKLQILPFKKNKKSYFFLDIYKINTIMCRLNFKNLLFTVHVWTKLLGGDRLFPIWNRPILNRQEGVNSFADNFGMCSWRPDSETVASRAFAQTSPITGFLRLALCQYDRVNWGRSWREFVPYDFVFCFSGIWPKRCTIPWDRG